MTEGFTVVVARPASSHDERRAALADEVTTVRRGVDLVVLPYFGAIPYLPASLDRGEFRYAERAPFPTVEAARAAAREREVAVAVSFYEAAGEGVFYSSLALVDTTGVVVGTYRQAHAINLPGQHEQLYVQPGTSGFPVFALGGTRVGFLLGGDLWVPEAARLLALRGAEVLVAIVAEPKGSAGLAIAMARVRAAENGCAVVLASRAGDGLAGRSMAFDAAGAPVAESGPDEPVMVATIDLLRLRTYRRSGTPLRARWPRLYGMLTAGGEEGV
jgi:N-carbamoylputrescine amidase